MGIHYFWSESGKLGMLGLVQCKTLSEQQSSCQATAQHSMQHAVHQLRFQTSEVLKSTALRSGNYYAPKPSEDNTSEEKKHESEE